MARRPHRGRAGGARCISWLRLHQSILHDPPGPRSPGRLACDGGDMRSSPSLHSLDVGSLTRVSPCERVADCSNAALFGSPEAFGCAGCQRRLAHFDWALSYIPDHSLHHCVEKCPFNCSFIRSTWARDSPRRRPHRLMGVTGDLLWPYADMPLPRDQFARRNPYYETPNSGAFPCTFLRHAGKIGALPCPLKSRTWATYSLNFLIKNTF
jgi:hypothetical protein